jgi:hypothetical protein
MADRPREGTPAAALQSNTVFAGVIAALIILFVLMNSPWARLGCDEAAWLTSVVKVLDGNVMGREAILAKGPYLLLWHLAVYVLTGPSCAALKIIGLLWKLAIGAVIALLAYRAAGRAGVVGAGILYIGATTDPVIRDSVYAETIFTLPVALAVVLIIYSRRGRATWQLLGAGLLLGFAVLVKQSAAITFVALLAAVVMIARPGGIRRAGRAAAVYIGGALASAVPWVVYILIYDAYAGARQNMVGEAARYVTNVDAAGAAANFAWAAQNVFPRYAIPIIASIAGLVMLFRTFNDSPAEDAHSRGEVPWRAVAITAGAWYLASWIIIGATLRFAAHYFAAFAAPAALVGGIWVGRAMRRGFLVDRNDHLNIPVLLATVQVAITCVLMPVALVRWQMFLTATPEDRAPHEVGLYLNGISEPGDTVYIWGDMLEVAYWSERQISAYQPWMTLDLVGYRHLGPLYATRIRDEINWERFRGHLREKRPDWVVVAPVVQTISQPETGQFGTEDRPRLRQILQRSYTRRAEIRDYEIWKRIGQAEAPD